MLFCGFANLHKHITHIAWYLLCLLLHKKLNFSLCVMIILLWSEILRLYLCIWRSA
jgi:hypothetical protein